MPDTMRKYRWADHRPGSAIQERRVAGAVNVTVVVPRATAAIGTE
jgi:hypothetical protein